MKKKKYPPKRTTLLSLILRSLGVVLVISLGFAFWYREYLVQTVDRQSRQEVSDNLNQFQRTINEYEAKNGQKNLMNQISAYMAIYQMFDIVLDEPISFGAYSSKQFVPQYSPGCHSCAVLIDEENNIAASSRQVLVTMISFGKDDPDNGLYVCDEEALQLPEVEKLFEDNRRLSVETGSFRHRTAEFSSIYVNRDDHTFIPHEGVLSYYDTDNYYSPEESLSNKEDYPIKIDAQLKNYELINVAPGVGDNYRCLMTGFYGESREVLREFEKCKLFAFEDGGDMNYSGSFYSGTFYMDKKNIAIYEENTRVYIGKKPYWLTVRFMFDYNDPQFVRLYWKWTILFTLTLIIIALLWCWRQNVINRAKYEFEDYQRDLTDHLAHDIKTPLMAISGYAENVLSGSLPEEEQKQYLSSIIENVSYTDSLINRTLDLNHMGEKAPSKPEALQLAEIVEETLSKYTLLLHEKQILYSVSGNAEIKADKTAIETIAENLISNAVKYTPNDGSLKIAVDKKRLTVTNTVAEKIDTKELKRPFVRGDKARSNVSGNGLGLAIAERAAAANGLKLSLSCTDTEFRAELKYL